MFSRENYSFESLNSRTCGAFSETKPMSEENVTEILDNLFINFGDKDARRARWKIINIGESKALNGRFIFGEPNAYKKTFAFVSALYLLALEQSYYPDIMFGDGFCYITLFTIKLKGIHENDFIMLAKIESMIGNKNNEKEKTEISTKKKLKTTQKPEISEKDIKKKKILRKAPSSKKEE